QAVAMIVYMEQRDSLEFQQLYEELEKVSQVAQKIAGLSKGEFLEMLEELKDDRQARLSTIKAITSVMDASRKNLEFYEKCLQDPDNSVSDCDGICALVNLMHVVEMGDKFG